MELLSISKQVKFLVYLGFMLRTAHISRPIDGESDTTVAADISVAAVGTTSNGFIYKHPGINSVAVRSGIAGRTGSLKLCQECMHWFGPSRVTVPTAGVCSRKWKKEEIT